MDYKKFKSEFEASGMTQAGYADKIGISKSMVSYYLNKAKKTGIEKAVFQPVQIKQTNNKVIRIKTAHGLEIEIPL